MSLEDIMFLELEGLSKTISDYTRENYILSYADKLKEMQYPNDKIRIQFIVKELLNWYSSNFQKILDSKYIVNKSEHQKSYSLLKEMNDLLK